MKKSDLVSEIASTTGVTGVVAAAMVDSLRTIMQRELSCSANYQTIVLLCSTVLVSSHHPFALRAFIAILKTAIP